MQSLSLSRIWLIIKPEKIRIIGLLALNMRFQYNNLLNHINASPLALKQNGSSYYGRNTSFYRIYVFGRFYLFDWARNLYRFLGLDNHERQMKWNESGFRPPLCTYRLNRARRTSWGWWDDWDDTVLQTQDSKFEPWRSEAEHATSRSRRLPTILTFTRGWGRNIFCFFETAETGNRTPNSGVKGSGANHYPRAPAPRAPATILFKYPNKKVDLMLVQRRRRCTAIKPWTAEHDNSCF